MSYRMCGYLGLSIGSLLAAGSLDDWQSGVNVLFGANLMALVYWLGGKLDAREANNRGGQS